MFARLVCHTFAKSIIVVQFVLLLLGSSSQAQTTLPARFAGADLDKIITARSKIEQIKLRLSPAHIAPSDITNIRPFVSLMKSRRIEASEFKLLTSADDLIAYLKRQSPVVSTSFCSDLGIETKRCEELDCLTAPTSEGYDGKGIDRKCPYSFVGRKPMPLDSEGLNKWVQEELTNPGAKRASWEKRTASAKANVTVPIREDAVLLRQFLSDNRLLLTQRWQTFKEAFLKGPDAFAEAIVQTVLLQEELRERILSFKSVAADIESDEQLKELFSPITPQIDSLLKKIALTSEERSVPLSASDEATADSILELSGRVQSILTGKLSSIANDLEKWRSDKLQLDETKCNKSADDGLIKIAIGGKVSLYGVVEDLDTKQRQFRMHLFLGANDLKFEGVARVVRDGKETQVKLNGDGACKAVGLIDLGIVMPSRWGTKDGVPTWQPLVTPGSLTIDVEDAKLVKALSTISAISAAITIQDPKIILSGDSFNNIGIDLLVSVKGLNAQFRNTINLANGGVLNDSTDYTSALIFNDAARGAVEAFLLNRNRTILLGPGISVSELRAVWPNEKARATAQVEDLAIAAKLNLGSLGSFDAQVVLRRLADATWALVPSTTLPKQVSQNLQTQLRNLKFIEQVLSGLDALKAHAGESASILQDAIFVENCSISPNGALSFDLVVTLNGDHIAFRNLSLDPSNPNLDKIANDVTRTISEKYSQALYAFLEAKAAKPVVDFASAQFNSLIQKLDNSPFLFFGIPATFHVEPEKRRIRAELRWKPPIIISGLEVVGFLDQNSSPPVPKLALGNVKISNQENLEKYLASHFQSLVRMPWMSNELKSKLKIEKDRASLVVTAALPIVGEYQLPPISFDWSTGRLSLSQSEIINGIRSAVIERLSKELLVHVQTLLPDDVRSIIGTMSLKLAEEQLVVVAPFSFSSVRGTLEASLSFDKNTPKASIRLIYDKNSFANMIANAALGYLSSGTVNVESPNEQHPEVRVSINGVPLADGLFNISLSNVGITPRGVEIDGVTVTIPGTIPIPPWILILRPRLGVFFRTQGFSLGGDITIDGIPILKIEADLQGHFKTKMFELDGTLVLLEFLRVFENKGTLQLDKQLLKTHSRTIGLLRAILPFDDISTIDADAGTIEDASSVNLLSLKMDTNAHISTKGQQRIELRGDANLPVLAASLSGMFGSDLFLTRPEFRLGGSISLLGLNPSLELMANVRVARLGMKVLGIGVTVIAPGPSSFTTSFLEGIIRSLLQPSFDLRNLKNLNLVINLLPNSKNDPDSPDAAGGDGSASSDGGAKDAGTGKPQGGAASQPKNATATDAKDKPNAAPPKDSFVVVPFNGVYTGYVDGYTRYRSSDYYCFSTWKIGSTEKPPCFGDIVSKRIADKLQPGTSSYLGSLPGTVRIPSCVDGTDCEDSKLQSTSTYDLYVGPDGKLFTFASSHKGKPVDIAVSKPLADVFEGSPVALLNKAREERRGYRAITELLGIEAQNLITSSSPGFSKSAIWSQTPQSKTWTMWSSANDSQHEPGEKLLSLVDINKDIVLTYGAKNGFVPFLEMLASDARAKHPIRQTDLSEFEVGGRIKIVWSDADKVLITLNGNKLALVDSNKTYDEIDIDPRSRYSAWYSTQSPAFSRTSLLANLVSALEKDRSWDRVRIKEDENTVVLSSKVGTKEWKVGLVPWDEQQQSSTQFQVISSSDFSNRSQCWVKSGWLSEQAKSALSDTDGKLLSDALMLSAPEYDKLGFRVDPRRLLDKCP